MAIISAIVIATPVVAREPWPGADEDSVYEVAWSVIAIRRARVGIVTVVAIGTIWRWSDYVAGADSHADRNLG